MLAASCSSSLLLCRRNGPSLQTSLPLCITTENLVLPQRAVISGTKNTRWGECATCLATVTPLGGSTIEADASALRSRNRKCWNEQGTNVRLRSQNLFAPHLDPKPTDIMRPSYVWFLLVVRRSVISYDLVFCEHMLSLFAHMSHFSAGVVAMVAVSKLIHYLLM